MIPPEFFRTARMLFRPFEPGDLDALAAIAADPQVMQHVGDRRPLDRDAAALWIARSRQNVARYGYGTGALVEQAGGRLVGWAGWARGEDEAEEVVYGFARDVWGQGCGGEIVDGLVRHATGTLRLPGLRAYTYVENVASSRALRRAGFLAGPPEDGEILHTLSLLRHRRGV